MTEEDGRIRVLYSFPHKIGANRICHTAWQQVKGIADAGAEVLLFPGVVHKPLPATVRVSSTLAYGCFRIPYKVIGKLRALALHDFIVARRLATLAGQINIVHTWPMAAIRTLKTARGLGIPAVLERPNANTRFAYEAVRRECENLGVPLPPGHEYEYNETILRQEEEEYGLATRLLCPSEFTIKTFTDQGFPREKLARHQYGFDPTVYYPRTEPRDGARGLTVLFAGVCAVRKGLHFALEAWLRSPACEEGTFLIAGEFLPAYRAKLCSMLSHRSIRVLGHRGDVPELMRSSDVLMLPSIEEGSPLVVAEAMGSGCVPIVSEVCTEFCTHMETGLVHAVGDVDALARHITLLHENRALLRILRDNAIQKAARITWQAAGVRLFEAYRDTIALHADTAGHLSS